MAPPKHPWFRFYCEALTDRKLRRLTPAQRWLWVAVLATARQSPEPGVLLIAEGIPATVADLAELAGVTKTEARKGLDRMFELGLIVGEPWRVTKWEQRQFESDSSTHRTRKHRSGSDPGTPMERSKNGPEAEAETEGVLSTTAAAGTPGGSLALRIMEACRDVAERRAAARSDVGPRWIPATAQGLANDHGRALQAHLVAHPDATTNELAALIDGRPRAVAGHVPEPHHAPPPVAEVLADRPPRDPELNAAGIADLRRQFRPTGTEGSNT